MAPSARCHLAQGQVEGTQSDRGTPPQCVLPLLHSSNTVEIVHGLGKKKMTPSRPERALREGIVMREGEIPLPLARKEEEIIWQINGLSLTPACWAVSKAGLALHLAAAG